MSKAQLKKSLQKRSIALRNALDSGVLNLHELRSFLGDVESEMIETTGREKPVSVSFGKYMLKLDKPPVKRRIA
jgi:hypothetical protein